MVGRGGGRARYGRYVTRGSESRLEEGRERGKRRAKIINGMKKERKKGGGLRKENYCAQLALRRGLLSRFSHKMDQIIELTWLNEIQAENSFPSLTSFPLQSI